MGRKYGRLQYGRYTYDLIKIEPWIPSAPVEGTPVEVWIPITEPVLAEPWESITATSSEAWFPIVPV